MQRGRLLLCMLGIMVLLAGCLQGEQTQGEKDVSEDMTEDMDEAEIIKQEEETDDQEGDVTESAETVARELYLLDASGLVVPQTMELPKTTSAAQQVLQYLVKDGPVTELLPNGFEAVLPAGTEIIGVNLEEDGTLIVDVSEDFKNYDPENELKIIQAMTHTLTQFDTVDRIKLWINGENQTEMPVGGTPLSEGYSRANGINLDVTDKPDLKWSEAVTMFYPKSYDAGTQFVPVTKYLNVKDDVFTSIVQAMLDGPSYLLGVQDVFNDGAALVNKPFIDNGVLQLTFNDQILKDKQEAIIADEVIETLVRTLSAQEDVDAVKVSVENIASLHGESGNLYDEPVSVQQLQTKEKM